MAEQERTCSNLQSHAGRVGVAATRKFNMAEQPGIDLNSVFDELAAWEEQLKHIDSSVFDKLEGPEL